jgi:hypothetical protein
MTMSNRKMFFVTIAVAVLVSAALVYTFENLKYFQVTINYSDGSTEIFSLTPFADGSCPKIQVQKNITLSRVTINIIKPGMTGAFFIIGFIVAPLTLVSYLLFYRQNEKPRPEIAPINK